MRPTTAVVQEAPKEAVRKKTTAKKSLKHRDGHEGSGSQEFMKPLASLAWDEAPTVKKGRRRHSPLPTGGARRGSHHKFCGESTRDLADAILQMRVHPGQQLVAGQPAGASAGAPATAATAA